MFYEDLADADLIVEAVLEVMNVKKELFAKLDEIVKDDCIFGSNTSSLSITEIANGGKTSCYWYAFLQSCGSYETC